MKDLIERLRFQARYTHGVVPVTMTEAADALEQQAAVIEQMREALAAMITYARAEGKGLRIADEALTLQPCPEVLNKVRAEAVRNLSERLFSYGVISSAASDGIEIYAQRIEKGEA